MIDAGRLQELRSAVVRQVGCPKCFADRGELCRGRRGARVTPHRERIELSIGRELRRG